MLIDAGEGAASALLDAGALYALSDIWISHAHADHVSGLPMLLQALHMRKRTAPLTLHLPVGMREWFEASLDGMFMFTERRGFELLFESITAMPRRRGGVTVRPVPNKHLDRIRDVAAAHGRVAEAWSFVLDCDGGSCLVTADVAGVDDVREVLADVAVAVVDATHVSREELVELAASHPGVRVIATHIGPECEAEARDGAGRPGPFEWAEDGMTITIGEME
jgi:glyoxylase-like metal-dependent hydrolase (beta-lactamase superfamily II)